MYKNNMLKDPNLMDLIIKQTETGGIVGNENAKKHIILACASTLNLNLDYTLSVIVEGLPGTGKTSLVKSVLEVFPENKIFHRSRISPRAFDHMTESLDNKIVFIEEQRGNQGTYNTKLLISEHALKAEITEKNGDKHKSETKNLSARGTSFITTTTGKSFDNELESRIIRIYPEDSDAYRKEVISSIVGRISGKGSQKTLPQTKVDVFKEVLGSLESKYVEIPFAESLFCGNDFVKLPNVFRNLKKVLGEIQANTLLHQAQRKEINGVITAAEEDYLSIKELLEEMLNPPNADRLKLEKEFGQEAISIEGIQRVFDIKQSMAYIKRDRLKDNGTIRKLDNGRYEINRIELPDLCKSTFLPAIPLPKAHANEDYNDSTCSNSSNGLDLDESEASERLEPTEFVEERGTVNNSSNVSGSSQEWITKM